MQAFLCHRKLSFAVTFSVSQWLQELCCPELLFSWLPGLCCLTSWSPGLVICPIRADPRGVRPRLCGAGSSQSVELVVHGGQQGLYGTACRAPQSVGPRAVTPICSTSRPPRMALASILPSTGRVQLSLLPPASCLQLLALLKEQMYPGILLQWI